jgi:RNA polymerase sigma factor for flagellar operon FliA
MGWYSRGDYARYRAEERANEYLQSQADREGAARAAGAAAPGPADAEATLASMAAILSSVATVHITSLEAAAHIADETLPAADAQIELSEMGARVRGAVTRLPAKERKLMELYYFGGKNLEEAGIEMGLSKSWACRLHARAVDLLRVAIADD